MQYGPASLACALCLALGGGFGGCLWSSRPCPPAAECGIPTVVAAAVTSGGAAYIGGGLFLLCLGFILGATAVLRYFPLLAAPAPTPAPTTAAPEGFRWEANGAGPVRTPAPVAIAESVDLLELGPRAGAVAPGAPAQPRVLPGRRRLVGVATL